MNSWKSDTFETSESAEQTVHSDRDVPDYHLPLQLEYVRPGMQLVENPEFVNARVFDAYTDSLSERDRSIFAAIYEEIVRRGDAVAISKWYYSVPLMDRWKYGCREAFNLFVAFRLLSRKGVSPFAQGDLAWHERESPAPDWTKLPKELAFLAEPAERYGCYQFDDEVAVLVDGLTPLQRNELEAIAEKLQLPRNSDELTAWFNNHPITDHVEAELVYFTIGVMTSADIWPPDDS